MSLPPVINIFCYPFRENLLLHFCKKEMTYDCNFGIINADRQKLTRKEFHMINFKVGIMGAGKIAGVIADT